MTDQEELEKKATLFQAAKLQLDLMIAKLLSVGNDKEVVATLLWQRSIMVSTGCTEEKALEDLTAVSTAILKAGRS